LENLFKNIGAYRSLTLKWILNKGIVMMWKGFIWLRIGTHVVGSYESGNDSLGIHKMKGIS
jgi:hypothetical protein